MKNNDKELGKMLGLNIESLKKIDEENNRSDKKYIISEEDFLKSFKENIATTALKKGLI